MLDQPPILNSSRLRHTQPPGGEGNHGRRCFDIDQRQLEPRSGFQHGTSFGRFLGSWCGPCRALGPTIEKLAAKYHGKVKVAKLNTDVTPDIAVQFKISGIPAVLVFNNGAEINRLVGVQPQTAYERVLDGLVS